MQSPDLIAVPELLLVLRQTSYPVAPEARFQVTLIWSLYVPSVADTPVKADGVGQGGGGT